MLKEQLQEVEEKIQAACDRAGRQRSEVTLIAVSKTKPIAVLQEAYDIGVRVFGENKVQELTEDVYKRQEAAWSELSSKQAPHGPRSVPSSMTPAT